MQLSLQKFDMNQISDDKVVVICGKRGTGKTRLVIDLLHNHRDIPIGTIISPTEALNKNFKGFVPSMFIHEDISSQTLANVLKRQMIINKKREKEISIKGKSRIDPRAFLILDDCLADGGWIKDKNVKTVFYNGRHYKLFFIATMQYPLGITPNLRTNIDFTFIFREPSVKNRKRLYENYASMFPTFEMFCQVMDQCTENYECLVINNMSTSNKLEDQVFWYKAELHESFRIGAPELWELSAEIDAAREAEEDDGEEMFDLSNFKKKGPTINVKKKH